MTRILFALLAASALLSLPLAAAQDAPAAEEQYIDCGSIMQEGLVYVTLCLVRAGIGTGEAAACIAWRLIWGQSAPCPT
jgi:hypothetical protein